MLSWEQWQAKAESSLEAAKILLDNNKPIEAANRAYYAAYQTVTGALIRIGQTPRADWGNWPHQETQHLFDNRICRHRRLSREDRVRLKNHRLVFNHLLRKRYQADYGRADMIDGIVATELVRDAGRLLHLLNRLMRRDAL